MEKITGRTDDMMIVRGVNVFPTQIEEQILLVEGLTPHYLCILTRPNRLDELTVQVEAAPDLTDHTTAATTLTHRIKDRVGVTATVEILATPRPGTLPRQGQTHQATTANDRR